jgi:hypothetical protein
VGSLNSRTFFWQWRAVYAASNPGLHRDRWEVDGVLWTRERHSFWGERYSVHLEVHRLEHRQGVGADWQLLVVTERWWGPKRDKAVRDTSWCKLLGGKADRVRAWLKKQESEPAPSPPDKANRRRAEV